MNQLVCSILSFVLEDLEASLGVSPSLLHRSGEGMQTVGSQTGTFPINEYLPNLSASFTNFQGGSSRAAYEIIYPIIRDAILEGEAVTIEYVDIEEGK